MNETELANWNRIKDYFETLPDFKRDNMFYHRACKIVGGGEDPIEELPTEPLE